MKTRRVNFAQGDIKNVRTLLDKYGDGLLKQVSQKKLKLATESLARMKVPETGQDNLSDKLLFT